MTTGRICSTRLLVNLKSSENEFLKYPCVGMLEIQEISTSGTIINAAFRPFSTDQVLPFVRVKKPVFEVGACQSVAYEIMKIQPAFFT